MRLQRTGTGRCTFIELMPLCLAFLLIVFADNARADESGPGLVVADTPVTHSLVSMVIGDISQPMALIQGSASPHDYALRPSEAKKLQAASILFWTSAQLTPWLSRAIKTSRNPVNNLELMSAPDTIRLGFRNDDSFGGSHDHHHDAEHSDTEKKSLPAAIDPHGWLDPANGIYWLQLIADKLREIDPANGAQYQRNADIAKKSLSALQLSIGEQLSSVSQRPFVVFHDSYHYFEDRFNIFASAAIAMGDAELPGIRRMNTLKQQLRQFEAACVFTEPQFSDRLITSLTRGMSVSIGSLDPLGTKLPQGPTLYPQLLQQIANELHSCLS